MLTCSSRCVLFHWKATPTRAFNEFLYEFLRLFTFGKFVKIRDFFCWGNEFSIFGRRRLSSSFERNRSGWTPKFRTAKFRLEKLETSLYRTASNLFRNREPFGLESRVWPTDGHTFWQKMPHFTTLCGQKGNKPLSYYGRPGLSGSASPSLSFSEGPTGAGALVFWYI